MFDVNHLEISHNNKPREWRTYDPKIERVYYGRDSQRKPINTLYTIRDLVTGMIYFGIARCSDKDQCVKEVGRDYAYARAVDSHDMLKGFANHARSLFYLEPDGLAGKCSADQKHTMLKYFYSFSDEKTAKDDSLFKSNTWYE